MATTTNYSWTTPDDTALVKDGASAIRTLGSSVDSTLKTQIDNTVASSIQKTLTTTTGDVIYASGANTPARLGIGSTGQVLTVSGGIPAWTTISSGAYALLSTTTLSSTSTVVSSINQTYTDLMVIINNPYVSAGAALRINPNSSSGIGYGTGVEGAAGAVTSGGNINSHTTNLLPTTSSPNHTFALYIRQYAGTTYGKPYQWHGGTTNSNSTVNFQGFIGTTSAISSLQFTTVAGTSTFSGGQVLIYGVK